MAEEPLRSLVAPWPEGPNPYLPLLAAGLASAGVEVDRLRGSSWSELAGAVEERGRPDVLHLQWQHGFLVARRRGIPANVRRTWKFLGVLRKLRRQGTAVVWTVHNVVHHEQERAWLELAGCRVLARVADRLIAHCETARREIARVYRVDPDRIAVVPHGHYIDAYPSPVARDEARRRLGLPADRLVLLFFGQIRDYKGVPDLLRALDARGPEDWTLLVAGEAKSAEAESALRERAAADPRLRLELGTATDERLAELVDACDAVVLPYRRSLTSGSAMLAGSRARAVIAPAVGCMEEMAGPGGILYDGSEEGLAAAIAGARREELHEAGERFLARVRPLSWERVGAMTRDVYETARAEAR